MRGKYTQKEINQALQELEASGAVVKGADGRWRTTEQHMDWLASEARKAKRKRETRGRHKFTPAKHVQHNRYECGECGMKWVDVTDTLGGPQRCKRQHKPVMPYRMDDDPNCRCAACNSQEARMANVYTGWDRIHDDNRAQGRPIGDQWPHKFLLTG